MTSAELPGVAPDVLVVGAGNAALCAAISAHQNGARVLMLEAAPFEERGGNSHFTGGAFRFAFAGVDDLLAVLPSLAQERLENVDFGTYTQDQFFDDLFALTQYRSDPDLLEILVRGSLDTAKWIAQQGVKLQPGLGRMRLRSGGRTCPPGTGKLRVSDFGLRTMKKLRSTRSPIASLEAAPFMMAAAWPAMAEAATLQPPPEQRDELAPFHCPVPPVFPNERNSTQGTAALRDFEPVDGSYGPVASHRNAADARAMSALPPKADIALRPAASSWRTPPSRPSVSRRTRARL